MKSPKVIVVVVVAGLLVAGTVMVNNATLWPDEARIRHRLLAQQPLGTNLAIVRKWLDDRGWLDQAHHETAGCYYEQSGQPPEVVGNSSLGSKLGHYRGIPWRIHVDACWAFDAEGRLIEMRVRKYADSI